MTERHRKTLINRYLSNKAKLKELEVFFAELEDPLFVQLLEQESERFTRPRQVVSLRKKIIGAAAAILLVSLSTWFSLGYFAQPSDFNAGTSLVTRENTDIIVEYDGKKIAITASASPHLVVDSIVKTTQVDTVKIIMPYAKTNSFFLPDGTKVYLNANSTLVFPTVYKSGQRWANVSGEAFFEVKSDKQHPFYVSTISNTNKLNISVTGTKFNVSSYPDDLKSYVALFEGHVAVNHKKLVQGQQFIQTTDDVQILSFNQAKVGAWLTGKFVFDDDNLSTILTALEKWYGVQFEVRNIPDDIHFGGTISKSRDLNSTLKLLAKYAPIRFERSNKKIVVLPR